MYIIYWLISEKHDNTYIGFSNDLIRRIKEHRDKKVRSTKDFKNFKCYILERVKDLEQAVRREKYWKSAAGRRKLKILFNKIIKKIIPPPSSSG